MKPIRHYLAFAAILIALPAFADDRPLLQVEIHARYEGFDRTRYAELHHAPKKHKADDVLCSPSVITKSEQRALIEMVREVPVPEVPTGGKTVDTGVTLEVLPVIKDGKILLSGKSVMRRRLAQDAVQPLGAISFATHETLFNGTVENGKEQTIAVGDGPKDKARIVITVRIVQEKDVPAK